MTRVIQDSDDEGDFGSLSPLPNKALSARDEKPAPGTSSTEALHRDIAAAHRDLIETTAISSGSPNTLDGGYIRMSSPRTSRKRRSTMSSLDTTSPQRLERRKTVRTYGHTDRHLHDNSDHTSSLFDAMRNEVDGYNGIVTSGGMGEHRIARETDVSIPTEPVMYVPGSLRDSFVQHEPAMFANASSTVPDATMTQEQILDAARAEYQLQQAANVAVLQENPSDSLSIPWSDYVETSQKEISSIQNGFTQPSHPSQPPNESGLPSSAPSDTLWRVKSTKSQSTDLEAFVSAKSASQTKRLRRSKTLDHPRLSQSSHDELGDELSSNFNVPASLKKRRASDQNAPLSAKDMARSSKMKRRRESVALNNELVQQDMIPAAPHDDIEHKTITKSQKSINDSVEESIRAVRTSKASKAKDDIISEPRNDDDVAIGLPKERYQPRPSRSRSARVTVKEHVDYSIIPEKAAKVRRRKTADVSTACRLKLSLDEKIERLIDMGFSPSKSREALRNHENDMGSAVQSLLITSEEEAGVAKEDDGIEDDAPRDVMATEPGQDSEDEVTGADKTPARGEGQIVKAIQPKRKRGRPPKNRAPDDAEKADTTEKAQKPNVVDNTLDDASDELHGDVSTAQKDLDTVQESSKRRKVTEELEYHEVTGLNRRPSPTVQPTPVSSACPEAIHEAEEQQQPIEEPTPNKRGRGRPRATPKAQESGEQTVKETSDAAQVPAVDGAEEALEAGGAASSRDTKPIGEQGSATRNEESPRSTPLNTCANGAGSRSTTVQPDENKVMQTPEKSGAKRASHSPLSKGKVPYRVGLSRRARIAPLLKIVKK